jgi:hypothetical protein
MKTRNSAYAIVTVAAVLCTGAALTRAASSDVVQSPAAFDRKPMLNISVQGKLRDGGSPGGISANHTLQLDAPTRVSFQATKEYPCAISGGGLAPATPGAADGSVEWLIEAQLVALENTRATIDVRWSRTVHDAEVIGAVSLHAQQRFILGEDQREVLDLLRIPDHLGGDCEAVPIVLGFSFAEPPELENAALSVDVWLIQTDRDGRQTTERFRTAARQGQRATFFFRPMYYTREGMRVGGEGPARVSIDGSVRARATKDGMIDLSVGANRTVMDTERRLGQGDGGSQQLSGLRSGETVEFPLPGAPFRVQEVLEGQQTALRVTVTRVW